MKQELAEAIGVYLSLALLVVSWVLAYYECEEWILTINIALVIAIAVSYDWIGCIYRRIGKADGTN